MAKLNEVLRMLSPTLEYVAYGDNYEDIDWVGKEPAISKKEFEAGRTEYDAWKAKQDSAKETQRQAILDRLGITAEEAQLLLS
jgi:hypothetical protein